MAGQTGNQDPITQKDGQVDLANIYKQTPTDARKKAILDHLILVDKLLLITCFSIIIIGILMVKLESDSAVKSIGAGIAGAAVGAIANRLKDSKLSPE